MACGRGSDLVLLACTYTQYQSRLPQGLPRVHTDHTDKWGIPPIRISQIMSIGFFDFTVPYFVPGLNMVSPWRNPRDRFSRIATR